MTHDYDNGLNAIIERIEAQRKWWESSTKLERAGREISRVDMLFDLIALIALVRRLETELAKWSAK